jgi:DNA-binding NarL/FixJ family response regulator
VRVVLADDSMLLREGVARLLEEAGLEVVAQAGDGEDLLRKVGAHKPDVAIVDVRMPPTHTDEGLRAAHDIRARHPDMGIVILSEHVEVGVATQLLAESPESLGYLLKQRVNDVADFVGTLRRVANGGSALDPKIVSGLLAANNDGPLATLTPREQEVLQLMAEGLSNQGIAERLTITLRSTEKYVSSIFAKLELPDSPGDQRRVHAVLQYLRVA